MNLNFELPASLLYLFCILYCLIGKRHVYLQRMKLRDRIISQHFIYLLLLFSSLVSALTSYCVLVLQPGAGPSMRFLLYLLNTLYFVFHTLVPPLYTLYIMAVNGSTFNRPPVFYVRYFILLTLSEIAIFLNPLTKYIFFLDSAQQYQRGLLLFLLYFSAVFYILCGTYFFIRNKRVLRDSSVQIIIYLTVFSLAGLFVQLIFPFLVIETFCEALAFTGFLLSLEDTDRKLDPVTGIYHRIAFDEENRKLLLSGSHYSIIHIHPINLSLLLRLTSLSNTTAILSSITSWLTTLIPRENVFCYRAFDFLIIVHDSGEHEALTLAEQITERFRHSWELCGLWTNLDAVVSVIQVPDDASSEQELYRLFDIASSQHFRETVLLTSDDIEQFKRELLIERLLAKAIHTRSIEVWYQPIWSAETNTIVSAEGLARLIDPEYGFIPPDEFIPIAEKNGMIMDLGTLVFDKVCAFIENHPLEPLGLSYIEINLSMQQFLQENLLNRLREIMDRHHVSASMINLEITESMADSAAPFITDIMKQMVESGFTFSLDDFGTAYSNIHRLVTGNYTNIKLDKSILWRAADSEDNRRILEYLTRLIRSCGLNTIQEGVETKEQLDMITSYGCNLVQGYYFSKPLKENDFTSYVRHFNLQQQARPDHTMP